MMILDSGLLFWGHPVYTPPGAIKHNFIRRTIA